jgi:ketose-bisphosphate aldolase
MSLQNTGQILQNARAEGYCVGAFNIVDYLTMEAVLLAASAQSSPVIVQTSSGVVRRYGARSLVAWGRTLAEKYPIPVGLHLDHGTELDLIQECIEAGYTSVMIDASRYPFAENVNRTRKVVETAHRWDVAVEGEIGVLAGVEDELVLQQGQAIYTTPEEAIAFQDGSGVDFLAVAIGTAHGFYQVQPRLDIQTLQKLHAQVDFPLVIHGGTGLSMETLQELVAAGASKLNISTQIKKTYIDSLESYIQAHRTEYNPLKVLDSASKQLVEMVSAYLEVFQSANRAFAPEDGLTHEVFS